MSSLTFEVPEEKAERLTEAAREMGMTVEGLLQQITEDFLNRRNAFDMAAKYVLKKDADLHQRLT